MIIPQLAQEQLGYTALLAGLILSPGGLVVLFLIPLVGRLLPRVQTRFIIAFGFFFMGCALSWAYFMITPGLDFYTLALIRVTQTAALAFLFVPTSTIAYSTLPKEVNNDASALYVMFRNLAGSIGISLVTAYQRESVQTNRALLVHNLTPLNPAYQQTLAQVQSSLEAMGRTHAVAHQQALGWMNQMLNGQAAISPIWTCSRSVRWRLSWWCRLPSCSHRPRPAEGARRTEAHAPIRLQNRDVRQSVYASLPPICPWATSRRASRNSTSLAAG